MDSELEALLEPHFLDGLTDRDLAEIRAMRERCQDLETALSYLRRIAQGRIDIVSAELARRDDGGDSADLEALLERLPQVLSDRTRSTGAGHLPRYLAPGRLEGTLVEELAHTEVEAHLSELPTVTTDWLRRTRDMLMDYERRVSKLRRELFGRIDVIQEELTRRYREGEADIEAVIAGR